LPVQASGRKKFYSVIHVSISISVAVGDNTDQGQDAAFNNEKRLAYSSGLITTNELGGNVTHQLPSNGTNIDGGNIPVFGVEC